MNKEIELREMVVELMKIISDFEDYYDKQCSKFKDDIVYERCLTKTSKTSELKFLREKLGIETVDIQLVSDIKEMSDLVVYNNQKLHHGQGKYVYSYYDAINRYSHLLCSIYTGNSDFTYKILQIGFKRFKLTIRNEGLVEKEIVGCSYLGEIYCKEIDLPIYSIDYIQYKNKYLACDFNAIQKLDYLGFDRILDEKRIVADLINYYNRR